MNLNNDATLEQIDRAAAVLGIYSDSQATPETALQTLFGELRKVYAPHHLDRLWREVAETVEEPWD